MSNPADSTVPQCPPAQIVGISDIFRSSQNQHSLKPIFPAESSLVISGPPGSGKTTMALALVRSMLRSDPKNNIAYFISTELSRERLEQMYAPFGWFTNDDQLFARSTGPATSGLHVINPPVELERPVRSSEDTVNAVIREIRHRPRPEPGQYAYVIIDSITALFKDCPNPGETRRQTHELIHRIHKAFHSHSTRKDSELHLLILVAEEPLHSTTPLGIESYLCNFVFRLGVKSLSMGTRLRTLEVLKSIGVNLMMGVHTWIIVTKDSLDRVFRSNVLKEKIKKTLERVEVSIPSSWCTIVICSRPYIWSRTEPLIRTRTPTKQPCGVTGLAEMLTGSRDYWFHDDSRQHQEHRDACLPSGSVTIITGSAGTAITSLALRIALSNSTVVGSTDAVSPPEPTPPNATLLVCFENDLEPALPHDDEGNLLHAGIDCIHRGRSGLHFNLLLMEVREWIAKQLPPKTPEAEPSPKKKGASSNRSIRIVIDGVSNLSTTTTAQAFPRMLDALIQIIHEKPGRNVTMILTYEVPFERHSIASEVYRLPADNIIHLRNDEDDQSKVLIQILKSHDPNHDRSIRALEFPVNLDQPCRIIDRNSKSKLTLELLNENKYESDFNFETADSLSDVLSCEVEPRFFSRPEINTTHSTSRRPQASSSAHAHLTQLDEWWIAWKVAGPTTTSIGLTELMPHGSWNLPDRLVPDINDFLPYERDKVTRPRPKPKQPQVFALPLYFDYGNLCVHTRFLKSLPDNPIKTESVDSAKPAEEKESFDPWPFVSKDDAGNFAVFQERFLPAWCTSDDLKHGPFKQNRTRRQSKGLTLFSLFEKHFPFTQEGEDIKRPFQYGIAWDSQTAETNVAFFFELCWAFGSGEDIVGTNATAVTPEYFDRAVRALMYMIAAKYAPSHPTLSDTAESLYSRQFYSTMMDVNTRLFEQSKTGDRLVSLGLMPPGFPNDAPPQVILEKHDDSLLKGECKSRVHRILTSQTCCGWGCSGSWSVGLRDSVTAPEVAKNALAQLTCLRTAKRRAVIGAGFPSRSDFYRHYGNRSVKGLAGATWFDVLAYRSFTRRRDRSSIAGDRALFTREVNKLIRSIMSIAAGITDNTGWTDSVSRIDEWWKQFNAIARNETA